VAQSTIKRRLRVILTKAIGIEDNHPQITNKISKALCSETREKLSQQEIVLYLLKLGYEFPLQLDSKDPVPLNWQNLQLGDPVTWKFKEATQIFDDDILPGKFGVFC